MAVMSLFSRILFILISLGLSAGSATAGGVTNATPLRVVTSNYPLTYFAERIGGSRVLVNFPVPSDEDPSFWKPDSKAVSAMQRAELILLNGADYEKWLSKVSLSKFKVADTSAGFKDQFIRIENAVTHSHGPGGMHSHDGLANNIWLDFDLASKQAAAVAEAMSRKRPELHDQFMENLKALQTDLAGLDQELKTLTSTKPGLALFGSHPVYQYLAKRYGLNLKMVHWEANEIPPESEWSNLKKTLANHPARWMLWEAQPDAAIVERLKKEGVQSLVFEPAANRPESGDLLEVMKQNITNLQAAYH